MDEAFSNASAFLNSHNIQFPNEDKLKFYAFYKQATVGDCTSSKPGLLEFVARAKWDAWNKIKGMTADKAKEYYVELLTSLNVGWSVDGDHKAVEPTGAVPKENSEPLGKVFSTLANMGDGELDPCDTTGYFALIKEDHVNLLQTLLDSNPAVLHSRDQLGLTGLHHACDRGHLQIVKLLVEQGADINAITVGDCETPLHFACISEQLQVAQYLLAQRCNINLQDRDGQTAFDVADLDFVHELNKGIGSE
ncbi:ACBP-domain-containing protein [Hesseltinella vesiculosa]|uniref:ACBP-domain-containing protein n=1 Tax=Hesseltinella vesiculosa TaxID=101127 RepID=A0A1X2G586_9FUNG|nr:ACBP-domain-containing protein [Hesseltinella vesiculosa]